MVVYIYRMTSDRGLAPCVKDGLLSLAVCKGGQIRKGKVINTGLRFWIGNCKGDVDYNKEKVYVIGTYKNKLLYIARITRVVTMLEYYSGLSDSRTDDIYRVKNGALECKLGKKVDGHCEETEVLRDEAGVYVLLSDDYIYLGKDAKEVGTLSKYNAKYRETKIYEGAEAERIVKVCWECEDVNVHEPHEKMGECTFCRC